MSSLTASGVIGPGTGALSRSGCPGVSPLTRLRVEDIHHASDASHLGNLGAGLALRVAVAVPALVMGADHGPREVAHETTAQHLGTDGGVGAHEHPLLLVQLSGFR